MKLSHRTALAGLVGAAVVGVACWSALAAHSPKTRAALNVGGGCPRHVKRVADFEPAQAIAVLRAVKAQVPRVYANLTSMGHPAWRRFQVQALVHLDQLSLGGGLSAVRGLRRYETVAARACGKTAAIASVLVFLEFPNCQLPCAFGSAYVTPTRSGWHLWTSYQI
jgi:hypothetical protein